MIGIEIEVKTHKLKDEKGEDDYWLITTVKGLSEEGSLEIARIRPAMVAGPLRMKDYCKIIENLIIYSIRSSVKEPMEVIRSDIGMDLGDYKKLVPEQCQYLEYVVNTNGNGTITGFDDDFEPIGPMVRKDLMPTYIEEKGGKLALTGIGLLELIRLKL